jgi:hypothetical protein
VHIKKFCILLFIGTLTICILPFGLAEADEQSCLHCGMYKSKFEHSWMNIQYGDGSVTSVCSVHCAAIEMALHTGKMMRSWGL